MKRHLLFFCTLLTACVPAAMIVGSGAAAIVYDGRGVRMVEHDARIFHLVHTAIVKDPRFYYSHINVTSYNQVVLLVGQTNQASLRELAEQIARRTPGVLRVYNQIQITAPIDFKQRATDTWIASEVRSQMLLRKGLESGSIRIVVENNVVYLMGMVSPEQANIAVDVARHVKGVRQVVKVFQYVSPHA